jgi:DNA mismatch endonuclease (patch repair protein)
MMGKVSPALPLLQQIPTVKRTKYPSFRGLRPATLASSKAKRANRSHSCEAELELKRGLKRLGIPHIANSKLLMGKPDLLLPVSRVAVFCDGDFWHGRHWRKLKRSLARRANPEYWIQKISANRRRDRQVNRTLTNEGWIVIRLWETDVLADPSRAARAIAQLGTADKTVRDSKYPNSKRGERRLASVS